MTFCRKRIKWIKSWYKHLRSDKNKSIKSNDCSICFTSTDLNDWSRHWVLLVDLTIEVDYVLMHSLKMNQSFFFRMRTRHLCYFVDEWLSVDIDWHLIVVHRWRFERCNTVWDFLHELVGIHVLWSINKHKFIRSRNVLFKLWRDNLH